MASCFLWNIQVRCYLNDMKGVEVYILSVYIKEIQSIRILKGFNVNSTN